MASVRFELPSLLVRLVGCAPVIDLRADTLDRAFEALVARHPELEGHLFDERGAWRQHVLCFLNEANTRWDNGADRELADGDRITIIQAVSGG